VAPRMTTRRFFMRRQSQTAGRKTATAR
jgi:hypothetical protein